MITHHNIFIQNLAHALPERRVTNEELIHARGLKMKASWVEGRLGIKERRWLSDQETTSDLAVSALSKLQGEEGPLVLSTISPDYLTPSTSSEVKGKMAWKGSHQALDISAACAGFVFSLELSALILAAQKNSSVYAVAAEARSRYLNPDDRRTVFLFGDAAVACQMTQKENKALLKLNWTECQSQNFGEPEILVPAGGAKYPVDAVALEQSLHKIKMVDGVSITEAVEGQLVQAVNSCLKQQNEAIQDYHFFCFHQGNGQLIEKVLGQIGASPSQTHINFGEYGNSSSASVGVVLSEAIEKKLIQPGQKVLLVSMGAGYHLGLASLTYL